MMRHDDALTHGEVVHAIAHRIDHSDEFVSQHGTRRRRVVGQLEQVSPA